MFAPALHAAYFFTGKALAEHVLTHQILLRSMEIGFSLDLFAKVAKDLHRALVGDVRPWCVGEPAIAVHHHGFDAIARQQRCCGGARRAGTNYKNISGNFSHCISPF